MKRLLPLLPVALAASFAIVTAPALAETQPIYKWTDASGRVNYGSKAPANVSATRIDNKESRITVIPTGKFQSQVIEQSAADARQDQRIDELQAELARERDARQALARRSQEQLAALRKRCNDERWVDCDDDRALYARYGGAFGGAVPGYGIGYRGGVVLAPPAIIVRPAPQPKPAPTSRPEPLVYPKGQRA